MNDKSKQVFIKIDPMSYAPQCWYDLFDPPQCKANSEYVYEGKHYCKHHAAALALLLLTTQELHS